MMSAVFPAVVCGSFSICCFTERQDCPSNQEFAMTGARPERHDASPTNISPRIMENIDRVLKSVRSYLAMDVAFLSEFLGSNRIYRSVDAGHAGSPIKTGGVTPMAAGYCQHVVEGRLPELIPDTQAVPFAQTISDTRAMPIGAHLSVPVKLDDGTVFGTFCCFSFSPNPKLDQRDLELMHTFSRLIANQIAADIEDDRERAQSVELITQAVDDGDPTILFQPIYRLKDLKIAGVEALSRFRSEPRRSPDLWFAEAEEAGMGSWLELLAVRKAIAASAGLPPELSINLNISPNTLIGGKAPESLAGLDPKRVVIEITEHTPIPDYEPLLAALKPLRAAGMRVAIDDAGAGYSSLRHVLKLSPDIIKLDVSLTRDLDRDPMRRAMAAALAEFGSHTGTKIVAEGIETLEELEALRTLRIESGQGFHLGHPQTAAAIKAEYDRGLVPDVDLKMAVGG
jgi:EAL domain-containing protein (putative c-di-GMP-specific phosphodiesterase class I)